MNKANILKEITPNWSLKFPLDNKRMVICHKQSDVKAIYYIGKKRFRFISEKEYLIIKEMTKQKSCELKRA